MAIANKQEECSDEVGEQIEFAELHCFLMIQFMPKCEPCGWERNLCNRKSTFGQLNYGSSGGHTL